MIQVSNLDINPDSLSNAPDMYVSLLTIKIPDFCSMKLWLKLGKMEIQYRHRYGCNQVSTFLRKCTTPTRLMSISCCNSNPCTLSFRYLIVQDLLGEATF